MSALQGKVAVVTGGGRGIGAATALLLAREGARVAVLSRTASELSEVCAAIGAAGGTAAAIVCDVSDEAAVERAFQEVDARFGGLDVLVNNAGAIASGRVDEMATQAFDRVLGVNVRGVFLCTRAAFPRLQARGGGAIVNLSSLGGIRGTEKFPGFSAYTASKFAVVGLTEAHAVEGRSLGIRVNAVAPGAIDTAMLRQAAPGLKTRTTPEDVAQVILFLADAARSGAVSGTVVEIFSNA
jgi:NAD(P)-dependent dehydrogenase (short-subunit alcohol dehydrogenase family)